jgi:hypothetical protein
MRSTECEEIRLSNLIVELLSREANTECDVRLVRLWRNDVGLCSRIHRFCTLSCGCETRENTDSSEACSDKGKPIGSVIPATATWINNHILYQEGSSLLEIMTRVQNTQANVVVGCEIYSCHNLLDGSRV